MPSGSHESWTHKMARIAVRPLVHTAITPNHLTTARFVTGLFACAAFAWGPSAGFWAGLWWFVSAFLDRADGELARLSGKTSSGGHLYDYVTDVIINSLVFISIGIGLSHSAHSVLPTMLGMVAGCTIAGAAILSEKIERSGKIDGKAYEGAGGFDFDDILYVLTPIAWLGWTYPLLVGATLGGPTFFILTWRQMRALA